MSKLSITEQNLLAVMAKSNQPITVGNNGRYDKACWSLAAMRLVDKVPVPGRAFTYTYTINAAGLKRMKELGGNLHPNSKMKWRTRTA